MKKILIAAVAALCATSAAAQTPPSATDSAAIRAAALDYIEGWYTGSAERMSRALHPDLAKRIMGAGPDGRSRLDHMTADQLVGATGRGAGTRTPEAQRRMDVAILDIFGNAASVRVDAHAWVDYMHLARNDEGRWVIVNVLWELRRPSP